MSDYIMRIGGSSTRGMTQLIAAELARLDKDLLASCPDELSVVVDYMDRSSIHINGDHLDDLETNYFFLQVFTHAQVTDDFQRKFAKVCFATFNELIGDLDPISAVVLHHKGGTEICHYRDVLVA